MTEYSSCTQYLKPIATEYLTTLENTKPTTKHVDEIHETDGFIPTMDFDESQVDSPDAILRPIEKKRLDWRGKTCKQ